MNTFLETFNKLDRNNLHLLSEIYAEDIIFIDPAHRIHGLANLTHYFASLYSSINSASFVFEEPLQKGDKAYVQWSMAISIEGVLPLLKNGSKPHLVGVGASAAWLYLPRAEAYGASKAAVSYMIHTLRITLAPENIDVSLVCPGFVKTPLTDNNDFPMPFLITAVQASEYIRKGVKRRAKEIHFPKRFTYLMKLFSLLPAGLRQAIAKNMVRT